MAAKLMRDSYDYMDVVYSDSVECPVDCEYFLPDYCPDIQKILKCISLPQVTSYSFSEDKLMVQGSVNISVLYLDEKGTTIRSCEIIKEFSSVIKVSCNPENASAVIRTGTGHLICRAVSARKFDIHVPVTLNATVCEKKSIGIITDAEDVEKKCGRVECGVMTDSVLSEVVISQELQLSGGAPPVESILRKTVELTNITCKAYSGKISVEAVAEITVIYKSFDEKSVLEKMKYQIPISDEIETDQMPEDALLRCDITTGEISIQPKEDSMGEYTVFSVYIKSWINIAVINNRSISYVEDAYSTDYFSREKYGKQYFCSYQLNDKLKDSKELVMNFEGLEKILDIWCPDNSVQPFTEPGKITYRGRYTLSILYSDKNQKIIYAEKNFDFSAVTDFGDGNQRRAVCSSSVSINDFRISGESELTVTCGTEINSMVIAKTGRDVLTSVEIMEEHTVNNQGKIILCYNSGEPDLWTVGKKYRLAVTRICEINDIADENTAKSPLMLFR